MACQPDRTSAHGHLVHVFPAVAGGLLFGDVRHGHRDLGATHAAPELLLGLDDVIRVALSGGGVASIRRVDIDTFQITNPIRNAMMMLRRDISLQPTAASPQ